LRCHAGRELVGPTQKDVAMNERPARYRASSSFRSVGLAERFSVERGLEFAAVAPDTRNDLPILGRLYCLSLKVLSVDVETGFLLEKSKKPLVQFRQLVSPAAFVRDGVGIAKHSGV